MGPEDNPADDVPDERGPADYEECGSCGHYKAYCPEGGTSCTAWDPDQPGIYSHEMTEADHEDLARVLRGLKGFVVLSGYRGSLYDRLYGDWASFDKPHKTNRKYDRIETVWLNASCATANSQGSLL